MQTHCFLNLWILLVFVSYFAQDLHYVSYKVFLINGIGCIPNHICVFTIIFKHVLSTNNKPMLINLKPIFRRLKIPAWCCCWPTGPPWHLSQTTWRSSSTGITFTIRCTFKSFVNRASKKIFVPGP